jgi:hypothetical protein
MPSTFYRVSIANATAAAPQNGFVDHTSVERYLADAAAPAGFDAADSQAKERGNLRFENIMASLGVMATYRLSNIVATGATADTEANPFAFTVEFELGDDVLYALDELNSNAVMTGAAAIRRWVARGLMVGGTSGTTVMFDYYDPTDVDLVGTTGTAPRGQRQVRLALRPPVANLTAAEALVTVTKITNIG